MITKEDYQQDMLVKFDELTARIKILRTKLDSADLSDKAELYQRLEDLSVSQAEISKKLMKINAASDSTLQTLKLNIESHLNDLTNTCEELVNKIKQ